MKLDKDLTEIINRVSNRNMVEPDDTKEAIEYFLDSISEVVKEDIMPNILIHNFGKLVVSERKIKANLNSHKLSTEKKQVLKDKLLTTKKRKRTKK